MLDIITDSTVGLARNEAHELHTHVCPTSYVNSQGEWVSERYVGENGNYAPDYSLRGRVTTEAVRVSAFIKAYETSFGKGRQCIALPMSSRLSGTYRSAVEAVPLCSRPDDVRVVDTGVTAGALEFAVRHARKLANEGKTIDEVADGIREWAKSTHVVFAVVDLDVLSASGRLGATRQSMNTAMNRYPVLGLRDGAIVQMGVGRGVRGTAKKLVSEVPEGAPDLVISCYGVRGDLARELLLAAHERFPESLVRVKDGGPVLTANLGVGAASIAWE
ncbi:MAG: DegV family protein [Tractidigestivibacter sp.]|uniref:DegV family protein n=1 Tax=Tractidigestivibacter sp. TaxID=2847320 RepID=UPI003D924E84